MGGRESAGLSEKKCQDGRVKNAFHVILYDYVKRKHNTVVSHVPLSGKKRSEM